MIRLSIALSFLTLCMPFAHAEREYSIDGTSNGFFNYDRASGEVVFREEYYIRMPDGSYGSSSNTVYMVDLKGKRVIETSSFREKKDVCIERLPMRSPDGKFFASLAFTANKLKLLDLTTNECHEVAIDFSHTDYSWSGDGKWLIFKDVPGRSFLRIDPQQLSFDRYSNKDNFAFTVVWSPQLKTTLYVFLPKDIIDADPYSYTSDDFNYFYINEEGEWEKLEDKHPLRNLQSDIYFRRRSAIEVQPWTEFFDTKTERKLTSRENFSLGGNRKYAVWLEGDWVYFQGASGVLNYRNGKFVSFDGGEENPVIPFSVAEGRYAIMYHQYEDLLKVYDLVKREYVESYEPFWRESEPLKQKERTPIKR